MIQGPRYANIRNVIMVGNGLTKVNGVGDNELVDADGYEYEPYDMAKITITAIRTIKATSPPGWT